MNEKIKPLVILFLKFEEEQYPEYMRNQIKERHEKVLDIIEKFGVCYATINTYSNMMQAMNSLTIDCFDSKRWQEGNLLIDLGSEPQELSVCRDHKCNSKKEFFNFKKNIFVEVKTKKESKNG